MSETPKVLLLDDSPEVLAETSEFLCDSGFFVETATTVDGALAKVAETAFDCAVLDLRLRGDSGISFIERMASEYPFLPTLVFVSGLDDELLESARNVAIDAGFSVQGGLRKPVDPEQLLALLRQPTDLKLDDLGPETLEREILEQALVEGEIVAVFQPQYDLRTAQLVGFEALMRWRPIGGQLLHGAEVFQRWFNNQDFRWKLFMLMVRYALVLLRRPDARDAALRVSVNAPAAVFAHPSFPRQIMRMCELHDVEPERLTLELTEQDLEINSAVVRGMTAARIFGFHLSLDDFGVGAANVKRLSSLPFTEVKIDSWFLRQATTRKSYVQLLGNVADICATRGIRSVIEGIETEDHLDMALGQRFRIGQGFYLGMPELIEDRLPPLVHDRVRMLLVDEGHG